MDKWNSKFTNFILQIAEGAKQFKKTTLDQLYEIISNYNSLGVLCLLVIIICLYFLNRRSKRTSAFNKLQFINLTSHVILAAIFGFLLNINNIPKINQLLTTYWSIGFFIYSFIFVVFIKELFLFLKSARKVTKNFSKIYYFLGLTYIFVAIATNQLVIVNDLLIILLFIIGWLVLQFLSQEPRNKEDDLVDEESDIEIKTYEQLLPTRKQEYHRVLKVLRENNYDEPFALVLNGDWGVGKTSLINVLSKKLLEDGNFKIFIQPMILDTTEKQMEYFFSQLEDILNLNGIYTGKDSPFKGYINIILQAINTVNLKQVIKLDGLLDSLDNKEQVDFRNGKERLEKDIEMELV